MGQAAGVVLINAYQAKGVNRATAGILYNLGLDSAGLADQATAGVTNATTFDYTPNHPNAANTGVNTAYNLTNAVGLLAYARARSLDKDPRLAAGDTN